MEEIVKRGVIYYHKGCQRKQDIIRFPYFTEIPPSASYWERLKWKIRKIFLASSKSIYTIHYLRSAFALHEEHRRQIQSKHGFLIHPFSQFLIIWRTTIAIAFIISLLLDPMIVFFISGAKKYRKIFHAIDFLSGIDILVQLLTAYSNPKTKETIFDLKLTVKHYLKTTFIIDFIGTFPFQVINVIINLKIKDSTVFLKAFRCERFFRYYNISCDQRKVRSVLKHQIDIILKVAIFIQFVSAFYYQVQHWIYLLMFDGNLVLRTADESVWFIREKMHLRLFKLSERYITTLFYITGIVTTSGRNNSYSTSFQEMGLSTILAISSHIFFCYIIILICYKGIQANYEEIQYATLQREFTEFSTGKHLPPLLCEKILLYMNYKWGGKMFDEERILSTISDHLRMELKLYECEKLLIRVPFFVKLPHVVIHDMVAALKLNVFLPGNFIIEPQQISDKLYFINFGSISIRSDKKVEIYQLKDFDYFGESSILKDFYVHNIYAISTELTELYHLEKEDWNKILWKHVSIRQIFSDMKNRTLLLDGVRTSQNLDAGIL